MSGFAMPVFKYYHRMMAGVMVGGGMYHFSLQGRVLATTQMTWLA
jgi:hypothetical protein